jgi:peptidoglycan/xylan/chitin deacetylase (PgdA/CDA1 family)
MRKFLVLFAIFFFCASLASAAIIRNGRHPRHVALTFDDGPSPGYTEKVLDILRKEDVRATFFVLGWKVRKYPLLLSWIDAEGHEIGNHGYSHKKMTLLSDEQVVQEVRETSLLVTDLIEKKVKYFRPPHGRLTRSQREKLEARGYKVIYWSVNADDYWRLGRGMRSAESIARRVISQVNGRDIVLMHDDSRETCEALSLIIRALRKRGYYFVTLSELLSVKPKT